MTDTSLLAIPPAAGHFDRLEAAGTGLVLVTGWILSPRHPLDSIEIFWDGELQQVERLHDRPDVATAYPSVRHAGRSGFHFYLTKARPIGRLDLIGCRAGKRMTRMSLWVRHELDAIPLPPPTLTERVASSSGAYFKLQGARIYTDLADSLARHASLAGGERVLDWGCGCGRLTFQLLTDERGLEVYGCDIDPAAIRWCQDNLSGGQFQVAPNDPPTDYSDGFFDVVIGVSVFTHLSEKDQRAWLEELRRILRPGGILLASVNASKPSDLGAQSHSSLGGLRSRLQNWLRLKRLPAWVDRGENRQLADVAPAGYYRDVAQSRGYTLEAWGRCFDVLDYVENGLNGWQDLVVARKRKPALH